jgi:hypothetical protein
MDRIQNIALNFFQTTRALKNPTACLIWLLDMDLLLLQHGSGNGQKNKFIYVHFVKATMNRQLSTKTTY